MPEPLTEFASAKRADRGLILSQSERLRRLMHFQSLLDHIPDMIMILNSDRQIVHCNRAVVQFAGTANANAALGLRPGELFRCKHAEEAIPGCGTTRFCECCGAVRSILQAQNGQFSVEECRMMVATKEGERALDLRVWASPLQIDEDWFTFFVVADIADEKRRLWLEKTFLHDLMNTASALRGFSGLLDSEGISSQQPNENVRYISVLSKRIVEELESHRQLLAAEHNELSITLATVNSLEILQEVLATYNAAEMLNGRLMRVDPQSEAVQWQSDPTLLKRVLGNMVKNALEGSVPGELVTIGCRSVAQWVEFTVHNPTYIPENIRLQIFNRSFSTKGAGRGLGTYSTKLLTENYLSGEITFSSSERAGTTFVARYPR